MSYWDELADKIKETANVLERNRVEQERDNWEKKEFFSTKPTEMFNATVDKPQNAPAIENGVGLKEVETPSGTPKPYTQGLVQPLGDFEYEQVKPYEKLYNEYLDAYGKEKDVNKRIALSNIYSSATPMGNTPYLSYQIAVLKTQDEMLRDGEWNNEWGEYDPYAKAEWMRDDLKKVMTRWNKKSKKV